MHQDGDNGEDIAIDTNYLSGLGLADRVPAWRALCEEIKPKSEEA